MSSMPSSVNTDKVDYSAITSTVTKTALKNGFLVLRGTQNIIGAYSIMFYDPKTGRATIQKNLTEEEISFVCFMSSIMGPYPDRAEAKINARLSENQSERVILIDAVMRFAAIGAKAFGDTKTQTKIARITAAFPEIMHQCRKYLIEKGFMFQEFVSESICPIEYQAPGLGPIVPIKWREGYVAASEAMSLAFSQGKRGADHRILRQSFTWSIEGYNPEVTQANESTNSVEDFDLDVENSYKNIRMTGSRKEINQSGLRGPDGTPYVRDKRILDSKERFERVIREGVDDTNEAPYDEERAQFIFQNKDKMMEIRAQVTDLVAKKFKGRNYAELEQITAAKEVVSDIWDMISDHVQSPSNLKAILQKLVSNFKYSPKSSKFHLPDDKMAKFADDLFVPGLFKKEKVKPTF